MSFLAAAVGGAGLLGAGASIYGANKAASVQSDAANKAAALQGQTLDFQKGVYENQKKNFDTASGNLSPFVNNGVGASNLLASAYGLNGNPALSQGALEQFQKSPDYQFALKGGSDALDNSAASKGGLLGGNQIRAQTEYGQGLATQNLQNYLTRLTGMSGQGIQAGGYLGQLGTNLGTGVSGQLGSTANNMGNDIMAAGTADASGILGMTKGFNSGLNSLSLYSQLGKSSYAPGGAFLNSGSWGAANPGVNGSAFYGPVA
jgi:hypothetical protein